MKEVYLLLGSNQGRREENLSKAIALIDSNCGRVKKQSSLYQTEAWGIKTQDSFLNQAIMIQSKLLPAELLNSLKAIEKEIGRTETIKWGPRVIDIDILFYSNEIVNLPELTIPHPFISERRFTLEPLNEIAGSFIHPVLNKTIRSLLLDCPDRSQVQKI